jgi:hypothetical protein
MIPAADFAAPLPLPRRCRRHSCRSDILIPQALFLKVYSEKKEGSMAHASTIGKAQHPDFLTFEF